MKRKPALSDAYKNAQEQLNVSLARAVKSLAAYRYVARGDALRNPVCTEPLRSAGRAIVAEIEQEAVWALIDKVIARLFEEAVSAKVAAEGNKNPPFRGVKLRFNMSTPMFAAWSRWPVPSFSELSPPASLPDLTPKQHVFLTLGNLIKLIDDGWDLERNRDQLKSSLENAASWEPLLANRSQEPSQGANHGTLSDQEDTDKP